MKAKNHVVYNEDQDFLKRMADEYRYLGRDCKVFDDRLVVFAVPRSKIKKQKEEVKVERYTKRERDFG